MAMRNETSLMRILPPLPTYLVGLLFVLLGERVFASRPAVQVTLLVLGGICIIAGALARLTPMSGQHPQRTKIDQWMALHHQNFKPFMSGTLDLGCVMYYLMVALFFLVAATKMVEARRWR